MEEELSAYELKRLQTIKENAMQLQALGIMDIKNELRALAPPPKPKAVKPKERKPVVLSRRRSSGRLAGEAPLDMDIGEDDVVREVDRDPNDVGQMVPTELRAYCTKIVDDEEHREDKHAWMCTLTEEQRARVSRAKDEWLVSFTEFNARFGSANEGPLSKTNLQSVVRTVMNR